MLPNTNPTQKIIERIRKLLAISGDPSSPSEAESALCKAQELLARHKLTLRDVEAGEKENEGKIDKVPVYETTRTSMWRWELGFHIAEGFRCKCYDNTDWNFDAGRWRRRIMFLGREEDVAVAQAVFEFACIVGPELARKYSLGRTGSQNFLRGFAIGVGAKLREQREKNTEWGLILACDPEVKKAWAAMGLRKAKKLKEPDKSDAAFRLGYRKGLDFNPEMAAQTLPAM